MTNSARQVSLLDRVSATSILMDVFKGQVALITGGGTGVGRAISIALSEHGVNVCLVGRRAHVIRSVAEKICDSGRLARAYAADITSDEQVQALAMNLEHELGALDILIHSAGTYIRGDVSKASVLDLDSQYQANLRAPLFLTQLLLPLIRLRCGQIVFINSSAGLTSRPAIGQFSATQHALKVIADSLRAELNDVGVRVLSVFPGRTATPRQESIHQTEGRPYYPERLMQPEDVASVVVNALALNRTAEVTDIQVRPFRKFE